MARTVTYICLKEKSKAILSKERDIWFPNKFILCLLYYIYDTQATETIRFYCSSDCRFVA